MHDPTRSVILAPPTRDAGWSGEALLMSNAKFGINYEHTSTSTNNTIGEEGMKQMSGPCPTLVWSQYHVTTLLRALGAKGLGC